MVKIAIIGNNQLFIDTLTFTLNSNKKYCSEKMDINFSNISEYTNINILIIDFTIINDDFIYLLNEIKSNKSSIKYLIINSQNNSDILYSIIRTNIEACISYNDSIEVLENAIESLMHNKTYYSQSITKSISNKLYDKINQADLLTIREVEIIKLLVIGKSTKEIAQILSNSVSTISTHRNRILKKLKVKNIAGIIEFYNRNL